jgi:hypothetical protein
VESFEAIGTRCGQPLVSEKGVRLFGGHTPRVTGAQLLAALGIEVMKIRIMARHSGEQILRYVAEAPLRTLRSDLGLLPNGGHDAQPFGPGTRSGIPAAMRARLRKLEDAMTSLREEMAAQAADVIGLATGYARTDDRVFVQNTITAAVHQAKPNDNGSTLCGWPFATARRKGPGKPYRIVNDLIDIPGHMICDTCLKTERSVAFKAARRQQTELSPDECECSEPDI